ncbi:MAG: DUF3810 domain-containing protein [Clostridiales bacterium]|nr:DUF3810 domain-containing protein [Candidatus Cacconaster stercorequi]
MKTFFKRYRKLHIWLLAVLSVLMMHFALRPCRGLMNFLTQRVLFPLERRTASLCSVTASSVAEIIYITAALVLVLYAAWTVRCLLLQKARGAMLYRFVLTVLCAALSVYAMFCLLWGVTYQADGFSERSGITPRGGTVTELTDLTAYFAHRLSDCADEVARDENGLFAVSRTEIFAESTGIYESLYGEFPFLKMKDHTPKAVTHSKILSAIDFTGFYFPFTGEANLNVDSPACFLPATIVHEMAHQRLIASEQECNFIAILGATRAESAAYRYSGWLLGYIHLSNALYRTDSAAWQTIRDTLPENVVRDIQDNNAYWAAWRGPVKDAAQSVYDGFLKSNGEEQGVQSYGTVVDLLLAYYGS